MTNLRPVVLSGGSGTRLWPLSTAERPKQFVPLFDGKTLFELAIARLDGMPGGVSPIVVTGAAHATLVRDQLDRAGVVSGRVLVEPSGRNTAPAAVAAALVSGPDDVLVIVPSDHLISDVAAFRESVVLAAHHASQGGIVTFGIRPSRPETGYGYIEMGEPIDEGAHVVSRFKEKPDKEEAEKLYSDGRHVWNSGMFVSRADQLLGEARAHSPGIVTGVTAAMPESADEPSHLEVLHLGENFATVEADSIDYAIMEKTEAARVIPIDVGWDDVGSYESLLAALSTDSNGNHVEGDVILNGVSGSFVKASSRSVAVAGLSNVVVVETPDAVLVVPVDRSQSVRDLAERADRD